jgi:hypothetical protein
MNPLTTLNAVRELSERALLRPAPTRLRLTKPEDRQAGSRPAVIPYEELHPLKIGGFAGTAGNNKARAPRPVREKVTHSAMKKDFMRAAVDKAEAAMERQPVVIPAGH